MEKSNALSNYELQKLYTIPIEELNDNHLKILSQALDDNKLKTSAEEFFERNPKFAAHYLRKYREYVKKRCPDINTNNKMKNAKKNTINKNTINHRMKVSLASQNKNTKNNIVVANFSKQEGGGRKKKKKYIRKTLRKKPSSKKPSSKKPSSKKPSSKKPSSKKPSRKKKVKRKVRTGPKGGKYILINGRKKYL